MYNVKVKEDKLIQNSCECLEGTEHTSSLNIPHPLAL